MKRYLLGVIALAAVAGGCSNKGASASKPAVTPLVTDIAPAPPAPVFVAAAQPVQPVAYTPAPTAVEPIAAAAPMSAGGAYTVQRGDTLYKLARQHYGDGKQWSKIAAANPGLNASTLKVGQKIMIP